MNPLLRRISWAGFVVVVFAFFCVSDRRAAERGASAPQGLIGTWKLVSTKYGAAKEFSAYGGNEPHLKLITPTHFAWFATQKGKVIETAGGRYTLSGDTYIETVDFGSGEMIDYLKKQQKFTIKLDGDKLFQAGDLSSGLHIEENWERVRE